MQAKACTPKKLCRDFGDFVKAMRDCAIRNGLNFEMTV